jgi:hypothetical protein
LSIPAVVKEAEEEYMTESQPGNNE